MNVQPYEPPRAHNPSLNHGQIPGMRPSHHGSPGRSATPIYDSLYAEYRRLFRALPGDRSGEEELRFEGFGTIRGTEITAPWHDERRQRGGTLPALPPGTGAGRTHAT
ncbi:hypothetical protein [Streptomyces gobiensis]|uniref:hypothetical protein n=1 Tax=Streptomyces gobiensis TaxID=2875706 RepID=UPI001E4BEBCC|nr:hypothetical protein [Streptomyces gobiensis]UGY90598.1 hypothetical protein test1122_01895 [Streptomyces gobiensis]